MCLKDNDEMLKLYVINLQIGTFPIQEQNKVIYATADRLLKDQGEDALLVGNVILSMAIKLMEKENLYQIQ